MGGGVRRTLHEPARIFFLFFYGYEVVEKSREIGHGFANGRVFCWARRVVVLFLPGSSYLRHFSILLALWRSMYPILCHNQRLQSPGFCHHFLILRSVQCHLLSETRTSLLLPFFPFN